VHGACCAASCQKNALPSTGCGSGPRPCTQASLMPAYLVCMLRLDALLVQVVNKAAMVSVTCQHADITHTHKRVIRENVACMKSHLQHGCQQWQ